jgi:glycosyltransferase involved in cell wall biosynthesis
MKIMHVADMLGFGGKEKITIDLANGLRKHNYKVSFVTLSNDQNVQASLLNKEIKVYSLPSGYKSLSGLSATFFWMKCLPAFIKILRAEKPDIVHTHLFFQRLYFASLAIKLSRIKTRHFHTIHTSGLFYKEKGIINKIRLSTEQRAIALNKAFIIAIADEVYKNAVAYFSKQSSGIRLIYNGVDAAEFDYHLKNNANKTKYGFEEDNVIVTYVARITEGKDHLTLLKAWKQVAAQIPHAKLCLAGDGELKLQMQQLCKTENIESSVTFFGTVTNVPNFLAVTDIGVFTSLFEGFSVAVLEQMFMQIPIIATNISPFNHFIKSNTNGFLFKIGDTEMLAGLIVQLINNTEQRTAIGKAGYETAQIFSIERMIAEHEEIYEGSQHN